MKRKTSLATARAIYTRHVGHAPTERGIIALHNLYSRHWAQFRGFTDFIQYMHPIKK